MYSALAVFQYQKTEESLTPLHRNLFYVIYYDPEYENLAAQITSEEMEIRTG